MSEWKISFYLDKWRKDLHYQLKDVAVVEKFEQQLTLEWNFFELLLLFHWPKISMTIDEYLLERDSVDSMTHPMNVGIDLDLNLKVFWIVSKATESIRN